MNSLAVLCIQTLLLKEDLILSSTDIDNHDNRLPLPISTVQTKLSAYCKNPVYSRTKVKDLIDRLCKKKIIAVRQYTPTEPGTLILYYTLASQQPIPGTIAIATPSKPSKTISNVAFQSAKKLTPTSNDDLALADTPKKSFEFQSAKGFKHELSNDSKTTTVMDYACHSVDSIMSDDNIGFKTAKDIATDTLVSKPDICTYTTNTVSDESAQSDLSEFQLANALSKKSIAQATDAPNSNTTLLRSMDASEHLSANDELEKTQISVCILASSEQALPTVEIEKTVDPEPIAIPVEPTATPTKIPSKRKSCWNTPFKSPLANSSRKSTVTTKPSVFKSAKPPVKPIFSTPTVPTTPARESIAEASTSEICPAFKPASAIAYQVSTPKSKFKSSTSSSSLPLSSRPMRTPLSMHNNNNLPITPLNARHASGKKDFQSPLARTDPAMQEKKALDRAIEDLTCLKRKYELYQSYKENNEITKVDRLIAKWKGVCQDTLLDLRTQIGEVAIPKKKQTSNPFFDRSDSTKGVGIHPSRAHSWCAQFPDYENEDSETGSSGGGMFNTDRIYQERPRILKLIELANMCQFDIHMIGKYDEMDDDFV
ncbi:hypothetical protein QVD99_004789 [Batrachochytrium dendrobatidis]|nr:hypothetical protein QVD99_004789 [Batrachochytrium dendrobatidis]